MATDWGLDPNIARSLLSSAKGKDVLVRTQYAGSDSRQHAGRAKLLRVINDKKAEILPLGGHKKTEDVFLSELKLWKSANSIQGIETPMEFSMPKLELDTSSIFKKEYCIISKKNCSIYGGTSKGWVKNPNQACIYSELANANRAVHKLMKNKQFTDAQVVVKGTAFQIMGELRPMSSLSHAPSIPASIQPSFEAPPLSISKAPAAPMASSLASSISGIDIDAILSDDGMSLHNALKARRDAAQEVKDVQSMLSEAVRKLEQAHAEVERLTGRTVQSVKGTTGTKQKKATTPKGALRDAIRTVLLESSRLDMSTIVKKVMMLVDLGAENPSGSIKQGIYALKSKGELDTNDNGDYGLTAAGRDMLKGKGH